MKLKKTVKKSKTGKNKSAFIIAFAVICVCACPVLFGVVYFHILIMHLADVISFVASEWDDSTFKPIGPGDIEMNTIMQTSDGLGGVVIGEGRLGGVVVGEGHSLLQFG